MNLHFFFGLLNTIDFIFSLFTWSLHSIRLTIMGLMENGVLRIIFETKSLTLLL